MLQTALDLVESQGLTVSLDHLSLENVITHADVSRSSAYRRWPYKDLFLADLLVAVARDTDLSVEPPGLIEELGALIQGTDLNDPQARQDLLIEALLCRRDPSSNGSGARRVGVRMWHCPQRSPGSRPAPSARRPPRRSSTRRHGSWRAALAYTATSPP